MSTAGRYVGAYRIPATEDVKGLLEKVANEKYFEQVRRHMELIPVRILSKTKKK